MNGVSSGRRRTRNSSDLPFGTGAPDRSPMIFLARSDSGVIPVTSRFPEPSSTNRFPAPMEEEMALRPLASVIPGLGELRECEDDASELFPSDDAAFQHSGSPFSSTSDAAAVPGDIGHAGALDPGHPEPDSRRNVGLGVTTLPTRLAALVQRSGMGKLWGGGNG